MKMMYWMLMAITPAALWGVYVFGVTALINILASIIAAVAAEWIYQKLAGKKITATDGSAAITGMLLGMAVSISTPWYAVAISSAFGIIVGKQLLGGVGKNLFNPAMFGRLFYLFVFPDAILPWRRPFEHTVYTTAATPLELLRETGEASGVSVLDMFIGTIPGAIGEVSTLMLLIGFGFLVYKNVMRWRITASAFSVVLVLAVFVGHNPLFYFFAGSLMLGAGFMATDPMTSPRFPKAQIVFGIGIGLIIMLMRWYGWQTPGEYEFTEGTTFAVLTMNLFTPYLNKWFKPAPKKKTAEAKD